MYIRNKNNTLIQVTCIYCNKKARIEPFKDDMSEEIFTCDVCKQQMKYKDLEVDYMVRSKHTLIEQPTSVSEDLVYTGKTLTKSLDSNYQTIARTISSSNMTILDSRLDNTVFLLPAILVDKTTGKSYTLKEGKQIVGRMAPERTPDIGIETSDFYMSRQHVMIEVVRQSDGTYVHYLANYKNLNETLLDNRQLEKGAIWKIAKKQELQMGDTILIIEEKL